MVELYTIFDDTDLETAELILQLQLEDVEEARKCSKRKDREDHVNDAQLALCLLEQNLQSLSSVVADKKMTQSIATAVKADGSLIASVVHEEEVACGDHTMALRLSGSNVTSEVKLQPGNLNGKILSKLAGMYMPGDVGEDLCKTNSGGGEDNRAESSATAEKRPDTRELWCTACNEPKRYFDVLEASCGHGYCKACLQELFEFSTKDESLFPPRCCREPIDEDEAQIFLTKEIKERFEHAKVEFGCSNRTYCSLATCSAFIPNDQIAGDTATCRHCGTDTCVICKARAHHGDCPDDIALHQTLVLATEQGWQRCYSCRRLVELDMGCNHMR
ncbi:uncharacterized protein Z518_10571 [Rhinocladiella mackenziei CBS 650.93]|uniref:RBR-type E3 ubiquitin transferase n=1 Tax=Rhinocladiella mackenziei CBS 650.93 TaxID=1442369 RepID=A0A0D2FEF2_9EURO|nr:uncharacterized protein Z518_10571 [Rhinocladiella mackenziei CBS 650.93]KIX00432.1 hypothetical protein Z518_10571 [Rhinocladiella mackenziei CBS 650.93]